MSERKESAQQSDPFEDVLKPPADETPEQRQRRVQQEEEAKRISQAIDESIRAEKQREKKRKPVRVLLLGQSESGKSTTLRQFQRLYTPNAFREERILWRAVIQLNLVRSVRTILEALTDARRGRTRVHSDDESDSDGQLDVTDELDAFQLRLLALRHVEAILIAKLVPPNEEEATRLGNGYAPGHGHGGADHPWRTQEVFVRPTTKWKGALANGKGKEHAAAQRGPGSMEEVTDILHSCRDDMIELWNNTTVRALLRRRKLRLEESPGFFLNDLARVTDPKYTPTDDDVLRARLKTVGVSEYKFEMEASAGRESGTEWRIIDVGGSRSQVQTWVPFFDNVDAIIFLAPISGFDQVLVEDRSVNRLEDSVLLWKAVCSNKLLANVDLVLFLNKCDILERKLNSGIRLAKYVRSYGDRANDVETVSKYFRSKFSAIQREHSPCPRKFYGFCTSVTDTVTTSGILASVRDMVVRQHLKQSRLL
ncbi:G-alpha-domain-containing protein [Punctularia strigosozonata HHB-11173 SS5]|uniref:G-alpha-domain-containing protein n=1 Tax=Punctularia strigosozonata (strain HHB-11173) TaxID=741275 RepID=UPI000441780F|nr:G-alpha-domain-containing protein [Punctularia strigosozonata HHB-11173 SS5]EIN09070.1 G-alpha-domain-containing protein [Punctularia strigosozonata HHB-11173 SS5]